MVSAFKFFRGFVGARVLSNANFLELVEYSPNRLEPTDPEYYNRTLMVFCGVSPQYLNDNLVPYKFMIYRHIDDGNTISGDVIYEPHPMYNYFYC